MTADLPAVVTAVSRNESYSFSKSNWDEIVLLTGLGVEGDVHAGVTVKHRSRVAADPTQPNLRQVHLMHAELHDELRELGFHVDAGGLGENITTRGVDLLALPRGTVLRFGGVAVEITGLRNPCADRQIPDRDAQADGRPGRAGTSSAQSGHHGHRAERWARPAGRHGDRRAARSAASAPGTGLARRPLAPTAAGVIRPGSGGMGR